MKIFFFILICLSTKVLFSFDKLNDSNKRIISHIEVKNKIHTYYIEVPFDNSSDSIYIKRDTIMYKFSKFYFKIIKTTKLISYIKRKINLLFLFKQTEKHEISLKTVCDFYECDKDFCFSILVNKSIDSRHELKKSRTWIIRYSGLYANLSTTNGRQGYFRYCFVNWPWKILPSMRVYNLSKKVLNELESIPNKDWLSREYHYKEK